MGAAVREPAAAGTFYPADPDVLGATVDDLLADASAPAGTPEPGALIVPHAGYAYSGPVAATGYALLRGRPVDRVALLGPAHFVALHGAAVPAADAWRTPLGEVAIDAELREMAAREGVRVDDGPLEPEHSLEVQLPFLQRGLAGPVSVLPVAVGAFPAGELASLIAALMDRALVIVSTDLSHYHDDATAKRLDRRTADAVLARAPDSIGPEDACGSQALRGIVELARRETLEIRLLDLRTSADTAGDPWRVVGYGAFAVDRRPPVTAG
jgi:AmmeMemoRadiSam system protein B